MGESAEQATGYTTRDEFALFAVEMIGYWRVGGMSDQDFRERLASLAVCPVAEDAPDAPF